jgi:hypothetical protein
MSDDQTAACEGSDAVADGKTRDKSEQENSTKTQDLARVGRKDFDPDEGSD